MLPYFHSSVLKVAWCFSQNMHFALSIAFLIGAAHARSEPCAEISASWAAQATSAFTRDHRAEVPAQLAYDCLMSVPVDVEGDLKEIEELENFLQFQSTTSYLKDGRYVNNQMEQHNDPLDLHEALRYTAQSIRNGSYQSDYEVQLAIHTLLRRSGDFHLRFQPDMLEMFLFVRPESQLVSISEDGVSLPQLYFASDLAVETGSQGSRRSVPSPLKTINDRDAADYLENLWTHNVYHDADARYNSFFPNPAARTLDMDSGGQFYLTQGLYDGATTTFGFVNGSQVVKENVAMIREFFNFTDVADARSFFAKFCQGETPSVTKSQMPRHTPTGRIARKSHSTTATEMALPTGYPRPLIAQSGLSVQGYHLNGIGYGEVAVLALPNFQPVAEPTKDLGGTITGFLEAQKILKEFIERSAAAKRSKLIVDLRGNSGGTIDMAFELFKQLFPALEPFGGTRYRAQEAFRLYSSSVADLVKTNRMDATTDAELFWVADSTSNFANLLRLDGTPFQDFETYYGPYNLNGDNFTAGQRYNFSNHHGGHTLAPHINISGYEPSDDSRPSRQPFRPADMVILQDGFCGSACSIFSQLMREQGHVQTIAIGGRHRGSPMQGVGGTRGSQLLKFDSIIRHMNTTLQLTSFIHGQKAAEDLVQKTAVGKLLNSSQLRRRSAHFNPDERVFGAVNSLDSLRENDTHGVPLEFVYEAADCRLFYTQASFFNPVSLWEMAADVKWGKKSSQCVAGSMGHPTAIGTMRGESFAARESTIWRDSVRVVGGILMVITVCVVLLPCATKQDLLSCQRRGWTRVTVDEEDKIGLLERE